MIDTRFPPSRAPFAGRSTPAALLGRMAARGRWWLGLSACAGLAGVPLQTAQAQATLPSQVVPDSLRPRPDTPRGPGDGLPTAPAAPMPATPASNDLKVTLAGVQIRNGFDTMGPAHRQIEASLLGRIVSVADLHRAALALQQAYDDAGYVLARVLLPPQSLADGGALVLQVIDGFIEDIVVDGVAPPLRAAVLDRLRPLLREPRLTSARLERQVLLAGELPGLRLRSTLVRGTQANGTRLVVEGVAASADLQLVLDHRLPRALGRVQLGANLALNSPMGWGEQWYASGTSGMRQGESGAPTLQTIGLGSVVPLGGSAATLNPELTQSRSAPLAQPGLPATVGRFERASLRARAPLLRSRGGQLDVQGSLEHITQSLRASDFDLDLTLDRYSVARMSLEGGSAVGPSTSVRFDAHLDTGLGGRGDTQALASGVPTSRVGASAHFTKARLGLTLQQSVATGWVLEAQLRGQSSFGRPLFKPEQLALDGRDTLPAFDPGSLNVDQGVLTRLQASRGFGGGAASDRSLVAYGFAAAARGHVFGATALEIPTVTATAAGLGTRIARALPGSPATLTLTLELSAGRSTAAAPRRSQRLDLAGALHF